MGMMIKLEAAARTTSSTAWNAASRAAARQNHNSESAVINPTAKPADLAEILETLVTMGRARQQGGKFSR